LVPVLAGLAVLLAARVVVLAVDGPDQDGNFRSAPVIETSEFATLVLARKGDRSAMWENLGPYFHGAGAALVAVGFLMLVAAAFRYHILWGLGTLLVVPVPFFVLRHFRRSISPVLVILLGVAVVVAPFVINKLHLTTAEEKPIEKIVEGEPTLTVTGLKDFDYATLRDKPYLEVLQMANDDVTDQTLEHLKGLKKLYKLDLSNTQITDDGLPVLQVLPKLTVLLLNGTKVSDEGVRKNIFPIESLTELSLMRTKVTKKTRDEWRAAKDGRKVVPVF
jgi:hypothetical protein